MALGQGWRKQYLKLIQQIYSKIQREKKELRACRENVPDRSYTKKPDIEYGYTDGDWALFINPFIKLPQHIRLVTVKPT